MPFETPGAVERAERLAAVAAMIYLRVQRGLFGGRRQRRDRAPLCEEAIRLARLLLAPVPDRARDHGADGADAAAACPRARRASTPTGEIVLLEDQDRALWNREMIAEGLALMDKAMRHRRPGPYQVQAAIAALHARAARPRTPTGRRSTRFMRRWRRLQPSPVVTLNRAVAVAKLRGPARRWR